MDYSKFSNLSKIKIEKYGKPATFISRSETQYNPDTGRYDTVEEKVTIKVIQTSPRVEEYQSGIIQTGDMKLLVSGDTIPEPDTNDYFIVDGKKWDIILIDSVEPGEITILYKIYVRNLGRIEAAKRKS